MIEIIICRFNFHDINYMFINRRDTASQQFKLVEVISTKLCGMQNVQKVQIVSTSGFRQTAVLAASRSVGL